MTEDILKKIRDNYEITREFRGNENFDEKGGLLFKQQKANGMLTWIIGNSLLFHEQDAVEFISLRIKQRKPKTIYFNQRLLDSTGEKSFILDWITNWNRRYEIFKTLDEKSKGIYNKVKEVSEQLRSNLSNGKPICREFCTLTSIVYTVRSIDTDNYFDSKVIQLPLTKEEGKLSTTLIIQIRLVEDKIEYYWTISKMGLDQKSPYIIEIPRESSLSYDLKELI